MPKNQFDCLKIKQLGNREISNQESPFTKTFKLPLGKTQYNSKDTDPKLQRDNIKVFKDIKFSYI